RHVASELVEQVPVGALLNSLGDGDHLETSRERETRLDHRALRRGLRASVHDLPVDLELVERQFLQLRDPGLARAEIVDGEREALEAETRRDIDQPDGVTRRVCLRELERDAFGLDAM